MTLGMFEFVNIRVDFAYVLNSENHRDQQLVSTYEKQINHIKAIESGIHMPSNEEVSKIIKG